MLPDYKKKTLSHLKKAEGHLRRVVQMVEKDKYCMDIIQQNLAVHGFLKTVNSMILESHLQTCVKQAMKSKSTAKQKKVIEEILKICAASRK